MKKKILAATLAAVLLVGVGVGGTLAWLTATSETVTNTFTVGDINITLAETTEKNFKIVPGGEADKDPTVTVKSGSEKCYVYVSIENSVVLNGVAVAVPNIDTSKWEAVGTSGNKTVYRYAEIVDAASADVEVPVFTKVTYSDDISKGDITTLASKTIVINSFAHQSDNIDNVSVADTAAKTHFGVA